MINNINCDPQKQIPIVSSCETTGNYLKVRDDGILIQLLTFLKSVVLFFIKKQRFGYWTLSPASGKSLLSWAQSIEIVPISGPSRLLPKEGDRLQSPKRCF
jgi:hypothetical protein